MIINLNEINRVLLSIGELADGTAPVSKKLLTQYLEGEVLGGRNPEFEPVIEALETMGLVTRASRAKIQITSFGSEVVSQNTEQIYELRPAQRRLLIRKCYLDGALRRDMKRFVKKLSLEPHTGTVTWSAVDSEPLEDLEWLVEHLTQLKILETSDDLITVKPSYRSVILQFMDESPDFSEEQFEARLRDKRLSGEIAEAYAVQFEIDRLTAAGHSVEAACVNRISKLRGNAGYDINSFNGKSTNLEHDRFIEVKGSGSKTVSFIWSANEMRCAKEYGERYWIYFVGGVVKKSSEVTREPILIQNPHLTLATDSRFVRSQHNEIVVANFSGQPLAQPVQVRL